MVIPKKYFDTICQIHKFGHKSGAGTDTCAMKTTGKKKPVNRCSPYLTGAFIFS
jgi:hypothetical protein